MSDYYGVPPGHRYPHHRDDSPDYPGLTHRARDLRRRFTHLSRMQAQVIAAVEIRPDRNGDAQFIGWDARRYPVFEAVEFGTKRRHATNTQGNPTDVREPFTEAPLP